MSNPVVSGLKSLFGLRKEMSFSFYVRDFIFRKILRNNAKVKWAIHHTTTIHNPQNITRGKGVYPGDSAGIYINAKNGIIFGDYSNIAPNVGIISANHDFINNDLHLPDPPIEIGRYVWVAMGAIILPGVKLGDFTTVGAGAIVTKSFPEGYCVIAGNPAKVIKYLNKEECDAFAKTKS